MSVRSASVQVAGDDGLPPAHEERPPTPEDELRREHGLGPEARGRAHPLGQAGRPHLGYRQLKDRNGERQAQASERIDQLVAQGQTQTEKPVASTGSDRWIAPANSVPIPASRTIRGVT